MEKQPCPACKGRGYLRDRTGEAEDCGVCHGTGVVEAFVCRDPEGDWIASIATAHAPSDGTYRKP